MSVEVPEAAINYAIVLAWTAHIDHLKNFFNSISEDSKSSMEKTCWAEELSIGTRVIRNYAMRTLADQCLVENSDIPPASFTQFLALLGQSHKKGMGVGSENLSIEDILTKTDAPLQEVNGLDQESVIFDRLYMTLKSAVVRVLGQKKIADTELTSILSKLFADYLLTQQPNLTNVNAFEGLASETTAYLKGDSPSPCEWEDVLTTFRALLEFHIEISSTYSQTEGTATLRVSRLRETGNNLMTNTCYPQAIQIYTDAIHACDFTTVTHLPQLYTNRAIAYIGLNCFREAVADLEKALSHDQTFVPAWTQMGYCQLYLGSTMLAIKSYLASLRSLAGEIYPYEFPADEQLRHEYTEAKSSTVMPQFVQKLVSSIILAVRRAEQQRESSQSIQEITTKVRAILARLRSHVEPEDLHYLSYTADPDASALRSSAVRADTVRPSILTPDIAQDIFASGNVEASAVTMNGGPQTRTETVTSGGPLNSVTQATTVEGVPVAQPPNLGGIPGNIRGFLNTLGNVVGEAIQVPQNTNLQSPGQRSTGRNSNPASAPPTEPTQESTRASQETSTPSPSQPNSHINNALSSMRRAISMAQQHAGSQSNGGGAPNTGMMDALRQHQAAVERMMNGGGHPLNIHQEIRASGDGNNNIRVVHSGPHVTVTHNSVPGPTSNTQQSHRRSNTGTPSAEDTEMPDAPDLD